MGHDSFNSCGNFRLDIIKFCFSVDVSVMFTAKAGTGQKLGKRFTVLPIETKVAFV